MLSSYQSKTPLTKAYIQMHISILLWGATGVLGRGIDLSEGMLVWYRMMIVTASLFLYVKWMGISLQVSKQNFRQLFAVGTILMIHWLFFYGAIKYSNVSITLSLFSSTSLFTALLEPLMTKKKFNRTELLYSIMAMAGIGIIYYTDSHAYGIGIILALLAAFVGSFFNIMNTRLVKELPSSVVSFYEIGTGVAVLTVFLPLYIWLFQPAKLIPSATDWGLLIVLAVLCTHVTLILSLNALRYLSAFTLNLAINLEPVYGIILAFIFFKENEELNGWFFLGTAIILLSVLLHAYFSKDETAILEVT